MIAAGDRLRVRSVSRPSELVLERGDEVLGTVRLVAGDRVTVAIGEQRWDISKSAFGREHIAIGGDSFRLKLDRKRAGGSILTAAGALVARIEVRRPAHGAVALIEVEAAPDLPGEGAAFLMAHAGAAAFGLLAKRRPKIAWGRNDDYILDDVIALIRMDMRTGDQGGFDGSSAYDGASDR